MQQQAAQHGDFIQYPLNVMTVYHISNLTIIHARAANKQQKLQQGHGPHNAGANYGNGC
ncbi:MAG: hypothetical protein R3E31_06115 [Chloroflexota bacterium]